MRLRLRRQRGAMRNISLWLHKKVAVPFYASTGDIICQGNLPKKLSQQYCRPFQIEKRVSRLAYGVNLPPHLKNTSSNIPYLSSSPHQKERIPINDQDLITLQHYTWIGIPRSRTRYEIVKEMSLSNECYLAKQAQSMFTPLFYTTILSLSPSSCSPIQESKHDSDLHSVKVLILPYSQIRLFM